MKKRIKGKKGKKSPIFRHPMTLIALLCVAVVVLGVISSDAIHGRWLRPKTILVSGRHVVVDDSLRLNSFTQEDFQKDSRGRFTYASGSCRTGVDVSVFQGDIDWALVSADGIDFAYVRAGSRSFSSGELRADKNLKKNVKGAAKNGLDVGVYFFSQAVTEAEAVEEAEFLLEQVKGLPLTLPVAYDWEEVDASLDEDGVSRTQNMDGAQVTACALAFFRRLEEAGYRGILYCNGETGYFTYDIGMLQEYPVWYASYSTGWPNYYYGVDLWQYTDSGKVKGIQGSVDLSLQPQSAENREESGKNEGETTQSKSA